MLNTRVHNHPADDRLCPTRYVDDDGLPADPSDVDEYAVRRGDCLEDDGCSRGAHDEGTTVQRSGGCVEPLVPSSDAYSPVQPSSDSRCPHVYVKHADSSDAPFSHDHWCVLPAGHVSQHRCATWCNYRWSVTGTDSGERVISTAFPLTGILESTPRRVHLVGVLTDLMAVLDAELDELAEVRRTDDRVIASDAEHAMDKLNTVWAKIAEARTAVRSCDLGHLPLPEVG